MKVASLLKSPTAIPAAGLVVVSSTCGQSPLSLPYPKQKGMCWYLNKKGTTIPMLQALPRRFCISISILSHSRWRYRNNTSGVLLSLWWAGNRELHTEFTSCNFLITAFLQLLLELWCVWRWLGDCWKHPLPRNVSLL